MDCPPISYCYLAYAHRYSRCFQPMWLVHRQIKDDLSGSNLNKFLMHQGRAANQESPQHQTIWQLQTWLQYFQMVAIKFFHHQHHHQHYDYDDDDDDHHHHHNPPFMTFISEKNTYTQFSAQGTPQNKPKTFDRTTLAKQPVLSGSSSFQHLSTRSSSLWRCREHEAPPKDWSVLLLTIFIKLLRGTFASSKFLALLPLTVSLLSKWQQEKQQKTKNNRSFWMTLDNFSCFYKGHTHSTNTPLQPFALNMPRRPRNIVFYIQQVQKPANLLHFPTTLVYTITLNCNSHAQITSKVPTSTFPPSDWSHWWYRKRRGTFHSHPTRTRRFPTWLVATVCPTSSTGSSAWSVPKVVWEAGGLPVLHERRESHPHPGPVSCARGIGREYIITGYASLLVWVFLITLYFDQRKNTKKNCSTWKTIMKNKKHT